MKLEEMVNEFPQDFLSEEEIENLKREKGPLAMNKNNQKVRKTRGKKIVCVETGEVFNSQREAAEKLNLDQGNISRVCRGLLNTCGGYHWKFVEV